MAARYIALGVLGMAVALFGVLRPVYPLVVIGVVLILAAFFWFSRTNQDTPAPAKGDGSMRSR